jgi:hypothetical protein
MSPSTSSAALSAPDARRRGRLKALFILAVCAAPTIAAYLAYYVWPPERRMNYGELLEPRPAPSGALTTLDGRAFALADLKGKWVLVQVADGRCEAPCQAKLFNMRQTRLAQGREMERIERVWLLADDALPSAEVAPLADGVRIARAKGSAVLQALPAEGSAQDHIYVVDPLGNLMMRFPRDADPKRMMQDIARLLKASRIG